MAIRIVRLGSPRAAREGPRLGTVRRPPRGVKKADYARRDYYDLWLPDLAPSHGAGRPTSATDALAKVLRNSPRDVVAGGRAPARAARALSQRDLSVGCYCEDESRCHRSILRELLIEHGARLA